MKTPHLFMLALVCYAEGLKFLNLEHFLEENNPITKANKLEENKGEDYRENILRLVERKKNNLVQNVKINHVASNIFSPFLLRGAPLSLHKINRNEDISSHQRSVKLQAYHWESCGPANQTVNVKKLTIGPDPVVLPGYFQISFDVELRKTLNGKLDGKILMEVQSPEGDWIHFPCVGNIGSCAYTDLCEDSQMISGCPAEFVAANIPCKCPFNKGNYSLDKLTVEIDAPVFLPGTYRARMTLSGPSGDQLGCYKVTVNFA